MRRRRHVLAASFVVTVAAGCNKPDVHPNPPGPELPNVNPPGPDTAIPSATAPTPTPSAAPSDSAGDPAAVPSGRRRGPILNPPAPRVPGSN